MSDTADRYRALAATLTHHVEAVPDDRWSSASPCEGWTTRDVVGHLVDVHGMFLGHIGREIGPHPSVDDDPVAAWSAARDATQRTLDDPVAATTEYQGYFGPTTFEATMGRFGCFDLLIHGWDLARAAGLDDRLDPDEVRRTFAFAEGLGDSIRSASVCGPPIEPAPDADEQTKLLNFLGRSV